MRKTAIVGARWIDPEAPAPAAAGGAAGPGGVLLLDGGRIEARLASEDGIGPDWRRVHLAGRAVAPGFLDLHFHGELVAAGPEAFAGALDRAAARMLRAGTTAFLATTMAWSREALGPRVEALAAAVAGATPEAGAACLGLHLEGPWISAEAAGAMTPACLRPFDAALGSADRDALDRAGGWLRMVTLAPELEGAGTLLDELGRRGAVAALGHTRADAAAIDRGTARGLRHVTHLFNAMGPMHHREPGVPGSVLARDALTCDLICDGHHVHPAMVCLAARALGERLVLITDRVDPTAPEDGAEPADDPAPVRLPDGTLTGSRLGLDGAVRNVRRFAGLGLEEAVAACTLRPARLLGIEAERGTLRPGARADLAVLDEGGRVVATWLGGVPAFDASPGGRPAPVSAPA